MPDYRHVLSDRLTALYDVPACNQVRNQTGGTRALKCQEHLLILSYGKRALCLVLTLGLCLKRKCRWSDQTYAYILRSWTSEFVPVLHLHNIIKDLDLFQFTNSR